jgi:UDP-N-acetylglucosamine:LPS N-acetylglucosamine transferase
MYPQQGEQYINAQQFERLGFGRILKKPSKLKQEIIQTMKLCEQWEEQQREEMLQIQIEQLWEKRNKKRQKR